VFFGIGAYSLAIMMKKLAFGALAAAILSPVVAGIAGGIIGYFCVRLTGIYFGMLTFAFQMLVYTVVFKSYDLTGGDDGLSGLDAGGWAASPRGLYYVTLVTVAASLWLLLRLVRSPFGLALRAQKDNDRKSLSVGIDVHFHRWVTVVIAAVFAGLAGALFALANHSVFPGWLSWTASATPIVMTVLGGMHHFAGPVVGAVIYVLLQTWLTGLTEYWALFLGSAIMIIVLLMPGGITSLFRSHAS
jgi:branched-chain amino acid transport system permease protein